MATEKKFTKETRIFDCDIVRYCPALAQEIGERESILLLQLEYWTITLEGKEEGGVKWIYMSMEEIRKRFPSWCHKTIFRVLQSLENKNYIFSRGDLNKRKGDRTKWYALNLPILSNLRSLTIQGQKEPRRNILSIPIGQKEPTIPESSPEISQKRVLHFFSKIPYPQIGDKKEEDICFLPEEDIPSLFHCLHSSPQPPSLPQTREEATRKWRRKVFMFSILTIYRRYEAAPSFSLEKWSSLLDVELCEWRRSIWEKWGNIPSFPTTSLTGKEKFAMITTHMQIYGKLYGKTY